MATIHINADTGDDTTGDGSEGNPYEDLPKGFTEASSGDTIVLQDAVASYTFDNRAFTGLTIQGEEIGTRTVRVGQGPGSVVDGGNQQSQSIRWEFDGSVTFELVRFTNITSSAGLGNIPMFGWGNSSNDTTLTVDRCVFDACRFTANNDRGGMFSAQNVISGTITLDATFTACVFNDITKGPSVPDASSVLIGGRGGNASSTITIQHCTFHQSTAGGTRLTRMFRNQGGDTVWNVRNNIFNNDTALTTTIFNETLSGATLVDYNVVYPIADYTLGGGYTNPNGNNNDPQFVDPNNGDFNLHPASLVRFTGTLL